MANLINNVLKARRGDAKLSTFDSVATALGVQSSNRERLVALAENYLRCNDDSRHHTENMAAAFAAAGVPRA